MGLLQRYRWLISVSIYLEYEAVLSRAEHLDASGLSQTDVNRLLDRILIGGTKVVVQHHYSIQLPDEDDDHVLALALNGGAYGIVTYNLRHFASVPAKFGINLYSPAQVLRLMEHTENG